MHITDNTKVLAVSGLESYGAITYWALSGHTNLVSLTKAWTAQGLDAKALPDLPSEEVALRRAISDAKLGSHGYMVRSLKKAGSWAVISETASVTDWQGEAKARITLEGEFVKIEPLNGASDFESSGKHARLIQNAFGFHQGVLSTDDISTWLVSRCEALHALSLRRMGGIYYMPPAELETWHKMAQALRTAGGHRIYEIPALKTEDAIEAITDAIAMEATQTVEGITKELEKETLGVRALKTQAEFGEQMIAKISSYEALLGKSLVELTTKVKAVQANVAKAILLAEAEKANGGLQQAV